MRDLATRCSTATAFALPVLLALALLLGPAAVRPAQATDLPELLDFDSPILAEESAAGRRCLVRVTHVGLWVTQITGERPADSSYAEGYRKAVDACHEGRFDEALDEAAGIRVDLERLRKFT